MTDLKIKKDEIRQSSKSLESENMKNLSSRDIYPLAKRENNTYNKAYYYFVYNQKPEDISQSKFRDWKKNISKQFYYAEKPKTKYSKSLLIFLSKRKNEINEFTIPMKNEIQKIIQNAHAPSGSIGVKHMGINATLESLISNKIYWSGMKSNIEDFIANCIICIEEKYEKNCNIPKIILANGPLDRVVVDLWQIPKDMINAFQTNTNNNYRYVLLCVDHFSKYTWGALINNKEAETKFEIIFSQFNAPNILQHDNGKEFDNQLVRVFCQQNNIKIIKSSVRHPQSQGAVEKLNDFMHRSLRTSLNIFQEKKTNDRNCWNIELALKAFINHRNNKNHSVTKIKPNVLILSENKTLISVVRDRIKNYYENRNKKKEKTHFANGMKVFIPKKVCKQNNFDMLVLPTKKKSKKTDPKKSKKEDSEETKTKSEEIRFKKIPALVVDVSELNKNKVRILVCGNPIGNILLNNTYKISINLLAVAKTTSWNRLATIHNN